MFHCRIVSTESQSHPVPAGEPSIRERSRNPVNSTGARRQPPAGAWNGALLCRRDWWNSRESGLAREGVEVAATLPSAARHADLTSTCARAESKRARANEPNERTDVERKPGEEGTQPPRRIRAAPRISNADARAHLAAADGRGCAQKEANRTSSSSRRLLVAVPYSLITSDRIARQIDSYHLVSVGWNWEDDTGGRSPLTNIGIWKIGGHCYTCGFARLFINSDK